MDFKWLDAYSHFKFISNVLHQVISHTYNPMFSNFSLANLALLSNPIISFKYFHPNETHFHPNGAHFHPNGA